MVEETTDMEHSSLTSERLAPDSHMTVLPLDPSIQFERKVMKKC